MDAITQTKDHAGAHSHVVRPADMEWQQTRFSGCEVKTLLFDSATGLVTALIRFAPGAVLPDHEHVKIEQTYVLEGKLVDKEGPAAGLEVQPPRRLRARGRAHARHVPDPEQVLRARWTHDRLLRQGLGERVGPCDEGVAKAFARISNC